MIAGRENVGDESDFLCQVAAVPQANRTVASRQYLRSSGETTHNDESIFIGWKDIFIWLEKNWSILLFIEIAGCQVGAYISAE